MTAAARNAVRPICFGHIDRRIERRVETGDTPEINATIRVLVVAVMGGKVRIGIEAPARRIADRRG